MKDLLSIVSVLTAMIAWLTHVIFCLITGKWVLLIAGAILVPVGMIHGVLIWLGVA